MDICLVLLSVITPLILGWLALNLFSSITQLPLFERIYCAFGLGFGMITLAMLLMSFLGIHFDLSVLVFFLLGILYLCRKLPPKNNSSSTSNANSNSIPAEKIFIENNPEGLAPNRKSSNLFNALTTIPWISFLITVFIILNIILLFLRTMVVEIDMWDSWAFWALKAKIFFVHNIIPFEIYPKFTAVWGNWDYPLHVPLMETWILIWLGYWNDIWPRIIFPLFFTGICVGCFHFLRRYLSLKSALAGISFLATLPSLQSYTMGTIAEPVLLFYYITSVLLLCRWLETKNPQFLILSSIFAGMTLWTKSEGLVLILGNIIFLLYSSFKERTLKSEWSLIAWYTGIIFLIICPWNLYKLTNNIQNVAFNSHYFQMDRFEIYASRILRIPHILSYHFFNYHIWNIAWIIMGLAIIYSLKSGRDKKAASRDNLPAVFSPLEGNTKRYTFPRGKILNFILFSFLFQCIVYSLAYVTIPWDENVFVDDTMQRLLMAPGILAVLYGSLMLFPTETLPPSR